MVLKFVTPRYRNDPMLYATVSEMRENLAKYVGEADRVVITKSGQPVAVLVSIEDFRSMQAMLRLARDSRRLVSVLETHQRYQDGQGPEAQDVDDIFDK